MRLTLDRRIFSDRVISKAVYWLSGDYTISRNMKDDSTEEITSFAKSGDLADDKAFQRRLADALNDFKLREIVADETRDIKTILYAKAFAEDEDLNEDDIHD